LSGKKRAKGKGQRAKGKVKENFLTFGSEIISNKLSDLLQHPKHFAIITISIFN
jgi:hypothetical protein